MLSEPIVSPITKVIKPVLEKLLKDFPKINFLTLLRCSFLTTLEEYKITPEYQLSIK